MPFFQMVATAIVPLKVIPATYTSVPATKTEAAFEVLVLSAPATPFFYNVASFLASFEIDMPATYTSAPLT